MNTLAYGMPGGWELLAVLFVILLLFGPKKLPELSRSLGKSLSEFKKGKREGAESDKKEDDAKSTAAPGDSEKKDGE